MEMETKNENWGFDPIKVTEMLNDFANGDAAAFQQDMEAVACIVNDTYKHLCEYDFYKSLLKAICSLSAAGDKDGAEALAELPALLPGCDTVVNTIPALVLPRTLLQMLPRGALVLGGCGVLFVVLGNYMPRIKQNYTFGCRTPWALSDEHNWNRTQRMGGIVFVVIGIAMLLAAVFARLLGEGGTLAMLLVPLFGGCVWIYVYSYLVFIGKMK